jgi:hypothetical protein
VGRPQIDGEIRDLFRQMSMAMGRPRIHGELLMLGIEIAPSTGAKYMVSRSKRPRSQGWKTLLRNPCSGRSLIRDRPTAPRSPSQNVEQLIGSILRECLDHTFVFG